MKHHPPQIFLDFFRWFCHPKLKKYIEGDLMELYDERLKNSGKKKADLKFVIDVILLFRPSIIRPAEGYKNLNHYGMLKNYFKIGVRNILKNKGYSFINVMGLTLGMTCCMLIFLWVQDEKHVDNFHANGNTLYSVYQTLRSSNQLDGNYATPIRFVDKKTFLPLEGVTEAVPEVQRQAFYATGYELPWGHAETFQVGDKLHKLEGSRASSDFFNMFSYQVIAGNPATALNDISSIAISRRMAEMFFDSPEKAIGQSIRYENKLDFIVTAIFENVPAESTLKFEFLINWEAHLKKLEWSSNDARAFVQVKETANIKNVEASINSFVQPRLDKNANPKIELGLQRFGDQYLHDHFVNGKPEGGRIEYVNIFSGVAVFILIIACINFMNLATARSAKRAKEVGVRKVVGSSRSNLIGQFLGEAILLSFLAFLSSLLLLQFVLPLFNTFTGKQITLPIADSNAWIFLTGMMLITGFVSGSYPAFFLSSLKPVSTLKGSVRFTKSAIWFRKSLSVFQFSLSIILLIATIVISRQADYIQNTHLGYDRENLIYIRIEGELSNPNKYSIFKEQATNMPGIVMVDRSTEAPHAMGFVVDDYDGSAETGDGDDAIKWEGKQKGESVGFKPASVGFDFIKLMNLKIVDGRDFSRAHSTDSADAFMVNEEAVKQMGLKNPIGKWVSAWSKKGHIIGILKNYHTNSLHEQMKP
ncbi:MAG TPA: ABC transporter permease, partial [Cyclobacteriaceae bacterium]|nr:ABC transporter permease [Cyclobacteriaceae bacterium]